MDCEFKTVELSQKINRIRGGDSFEILEKRFEFALRWYRYGKKEAISLEWEGNNQYGIGVLLEISVAEQKFSQWIVSGTSLETGNPPLLHFGLWKFEFIDEVRVYWPIGKSPLCKTFLLRST